MIPVSRFQVHDSTTIHVIGAKVFHPNTSDFDSLEPEAAAVAVGAGRVKQSLPRCGEDFREAVETAELRRLRTHDFRRERSGHGFHRLAAIDASHAGTGVHRNTRQVWRGRVNGMSSRPESVVSPVNTSRISSLKPDE